MTRPSFDPALMAPWVEAQARGCSEDCKRLRTELGNIVKRLAHRWFVVRDAKSEKLTLLNPRLRCRFCAGR